MTLERIERGAGVAAWRQIADQLGEEIRSGQLLSGSQLPTEARLALRFGVNRHTVRRAIRALADEGIVRATQGRGTFVEQSPIAYHIGTRTRFSENVLRSGRQAGGEILGAEEIPATADLAEQLRIEPGQSVLRLRTRRFVDGTPVSLGRSHLPLPRFAGLEDVRRQAERMTDALLAYGISDYRRTRSTVSARPATPEEADLLDLAPGRILLVVHSVDVDLDGTPIDAGQACFVADRIELHFGED
ncbi:phosphonate metabolism transcriptional regulator PhnF [Arboricoccus pini]|uniref:phosphonate metabolism transcriptional regulator PhnF n=1 Tax=Arboricoccus pini TaxID=1963835 RepID=UPI001FAEEE50|nr:phosphonate metabolism transcriptional regulator PhnF [Arboricoccus pini]